MRTVSITVVMLAVAALALAPQGVAGTKSTSNWVAPDIEARAYRKVLVLAMFADESAKRILEDTVVKKLRGKNVTAVAAYDVLAPEDLASDEAIEAKAVQLGVDAGIVFTVEGESTAVKSGPAVHASVGVPVRAGPFSVFLGTSVPLGGGSSSLNTTTVKAEFHAKDGKNPRWIGTYATDLKGGTERAVQELASQAAKQISKAGLIK
jgi:hypothetical protein